MSPFRRRSVEAEDRDLGFGSLAQRGNHRLVNRDGSFAVSREGGRWHRSLTAYHALLTMSWRRFLLMAALTYAGFNLLFGLAYLACGPGAIAGPPPEDPSMGGPVLRAFILAVHTSSTVGYGQLVPASVPAHLVMTVQAFLTLVLVALGTGIVFARFSRPNADLAWSEHAVVAPYRGIRAFMVRVANRRENQIVDMQAKLILTLFEERDGKRHRGFYELELERRKVSFLPLSWTIVHPIDESSPLHGLDERSFADCEPEVIVLLQGRDTMTSQDIHDWISYTADEVVFDARFVRIFDPTPEGTVRMDLDRIGFGVYLSLHVSVLEVLSRGLG